MCAWRTIPLSDPAAPFSNGSRQRETAFLEVARTSISIGKLLFAETCCDGGYRSSSGMAVAKHKEKRRGKGMGATGFHPGGENGGSAKNLKGGHC
jgi:hypothetical protein